MTTDTAPIPMFEAYLRHAESPVTGVPSKKFDWILAILAFSIFSFRDGPDWTFFVGILAGAGVLFGLRAFRMARLAKLKPSVRIAYERWTKVQRMKKLLHERRLKKKVPEPVLMALEQAARTWHDAREGLSAIAAADPDLDAEVIQSLDLAMLAAAAAADPVVLRDDQYKKDLKLLEEDADLMTRVCLRIQQEEARMQQWARGSDGPGNLGSVRERLEMARREREIAEAELDTLI